jgi:hypothetical protein
MRGRSYTTLIFVLSALICGYDTYIAVRSGGHNIVAIILAVIMALIAISSLRQLVL